MASVTADGAYDRDLVYQAADARQAGPSPEVVIPPWADAVPSTADSNQQSPRDRHIRLMSERGRIGWQRATGYGKRNHVETTMSRYKYLVGPKLRARLHAPTPLRGLDRVRGEWKLVTMAWNMKRMFVLAAAI